MRLGRANGALLLVLACVVSCSNDTPRAKTHVARNEPGAAAAVPVRSEANTAPHIDWIQIDPKEPTAGETIAVIVEASDAEGDSVYFRYAWTIDGKEAGNSPTLAPRGLSKGTNIGIKAIASDGKSDSEAAYAYATTKNAAPEIQRIVVERGRELTADAQIVVHPEARDRDGDTVSFRYEWSVNGRRVREEGPTLSTDGMRRGDSVQVTVVAMDGEDESEKFVPPLLSLINAAPRIVSKPGEFSEDGVFSYQVSADDPDGDRVFRFSLENAPVGMSIEPATGRLAWSPHPDQLGTHSVTVIVEDLEGDRGSQVVELNVDEPARDVEQPAKTYW